MLEESLGCVVPEVRIRYHGDNVTVRLPMDDTLRTEVRAAIERARTLRETVERPPIADNERLCQRCSLAPVCLPEEVRQDRQPSREPRRLFPADDQRTALHVVSQGATVGRSGDRLVVRVPDEAATTHPSRVLSAVVLHGFAQITTQAIRLCQDNDVGVHWLTAGGVHVASLTATVGQVQRRIRQYGALTNPTTRLRLAKQLVRARIAGQHRYLLRATRGNDASRAKINASLRAIGGHLAMIDRADHADSLRGHEGDAAAQYFAAVPILLASRLPDTLRYTGRTRRPPLDRFSAILSFGYGLVHTAVMGAVLAVGLEPAFGFYHTPRSSAHPLVLDLVDLFRVPLWDMVVVGSLNRGQWDPEADFAVTPTKIWLSASGRKKAIELFESRLQETWKHPVVQYSLSYRRMVELEARLLEKEWTGEPGLFARLRLR